MDNDAVIDEIIHEIMMMFVSVNAKNSPAISPVKDTSASCIPSIIDDLESNVFAIAIKIAYIYCILPQAKNLNFLYGIKNKMNILCLFLFNSLF